jgi:hypothetical protein
VRRPDRLARALAANSSRRSFLGRLGALVLLLVGARTTRVAAGGGIGLPGTEPLPGGWFGFCGHTWTTASCPHPATLPRVDARGLPLRPSDGRPLDNLGRLVDAHGMPVDEAGNRLLGPDGIPLPRAPRTRICADWVPEQHGVDAHVQGSWYRCCEGQVRKLSDCCSLSRVRLNGDAALQGYCYGPRRVFCVTYYDTGVPC